MTLDLATVADAINGIDFDRPFTLTAEGDITFPSGVWAPEVWHVEGEQSPNDIEGYGSEWSPLTGMTGQYGYRGAVMHASEYIGTGIARTLLDLAADEPQTFAVVVVTDLSDSEPVGWAIFHLTS